MFCRDNQKNIYKQLNDEYIKKNEFNEIKCRELITKEIINYTKTDDFKNFCIEKSSNGFQVASIKIEYIKPIYDILNSSEFKYCRKYDYHSTISFNKNNEMKYSPGGFFIYRNEILIKLFD